MKAYGHTKTLFVQAGKYKWSYKYEHCTECKTCDSKHKGGGLCTKCWDRKRGEKPERKKQRYESGKKWYEKNYIPVPPEKRKPMGPKPSGNFDRKKYQASWYQKWKEAIIILNKGKIWSKKGILLPSYKGNPIPFDIGPRQKGEPLEAYEERMRKFDKVREYIDK